jgi:hypothetical protein
MTRTVAVVVMLADYLPEMQRVHLITLIIMIGIVNSSARIHRQVFYRFALTKLTVQPVRPIREQFAIEFHVS